jgi:hypothetical protein
MVNTELKDGQITFTFCMISVQLLRKQNHQVYIDSNIAIFR